LAGGTIAKNIGLIDWDMARIYDWACNMLLGLREDVEPPRNNAIEIVGDFIRRNTQNILVVNDGADFAPTCMPLRYWSLAQRTNDPVGA
jgi:hypothetical protein